MCVVISSMSIIGPLRAYIWCICAYKLGGNALAQLQRALVMYGLWVPLKSSYLKHMTTQLRESEKPDRHGISMAVS
jgi:hypothetical protein